jgi:hypothetical protein
MLKANADPGLHIGYKPQKARKILLTAEAHKVSKNIEAPSKILGARVLKAARSVMRKHKY